MDNAQVTQEAREAAAKLIERTDAYRLSPMITAGDDDGHYIVQAFAKFERDTLARHRLENADDEEETHKIGFDEGRQEMVREIDLATGGDGEFRYCMNGDPDRHCPDAEAMKARVLERFAARHRLERSEPVGWRYTAHTPDGPKIVLTPFDLVHYDGYPVTDETPLYTTTPEPVADIERLRDDLNKARGILERLRDFDGWQGTFHAGHAYDARQEAIAYLKGASSSSSEGA